jgi:hypothetical protein
MQPAGNDHMQNHQLNGSKADRLRGFRPHPLKPKHDPYLCGISDQCPGCLAEEEVNTEHTTQDTEDIALEEETGCGAGREVTDGESCVLSSVLTPEQEDDYLRIMFDLACQSPLPQAAARFHLPKLKLLVALCRELSRAVDGGVWYLSCRAAGKLLDVSHVKASDWLGRLAHAGVIICAVRGSRNSMLASQYRYLGD